MIISLKQIAQENGINYADLEKRAVAGEIKARQVGEMWVMNAKHVPSLKVKNNDNTRLQKR